MTFLESFLSFPFRVLLMLVSPRQGHCRGGWLQQSNFHSRIEDGPGWMSHPTAPYLTLPWHWLSLPGGQSPSFGWGAQRCSNSKLTKEEQASSHFSRCCYLQASLCLEEVTRILKCINTYKSAFSLVTWRLSFVCGCIILQAVLYSGKSFCFLLFETGFHVPQADQELMM